MKVLVLHGWEHSSADWSVVGDLLRRDHEVVIVDFPGISENQDEYAGWGVCEYAVWLCDECDLGSFDVVIAHSFGGRVIVEVMAKNDYHFPWLILIGTPLIRRRKSTLSYMSSFAGRFLPQKIKKTILHSVNPDAQIAKDHGNYESFKKIISYDQREQLQGIDSQTLIVWGEYDEAVPVSVAREISTLIPRATLRIVPSVGHNVHLQKPTLLYGTITRFLESH